MDGSEKHNKLLITAAFHHQLANNRWSPQILLIFMRFPKLGKWNFFFLDLRASSSNVNPGMLESVDKVSSGSLESDGCCSCFCACWKTSSSAESDCEVCKKGY